MRPLNAGVALFALALAASAGAAQAHVAYYTTYRPVTRYVAKTVVVRERVWRPVRHRVYYRPAVGHRYYAPYAYSYVTPYPAYADNDWRWEERRRAHERWEHEHWEHRGW